MLVIGLFSNHKVIMLVIGLFKVKPKYKAIEKDHAAVTGKHEHLQKKKKI